MRTRRCESEAKGGGIDVKKKITNLVLVCFHEMAKTWWIVWT